VNPDQAQATGPGRTAREPEVALRRGAAIEALWPFFAGLLAGAAGSVLLSALSARKGFDPRLVPVPDDGRDVLPTVLVPGLMGSELCHPDGQKVWLNLGNAFGSYDIAPPLALPLGDDPDALVAGGLLGVDAVLPRLFGFTEYSELVELLEAAGFRRGGDARRGLRYSVFTYDWRRDLVGSARALGRALDGLALDTGCERFNLVAHSMGGLVARYYLRYGEAEPGGPVTWAGARRIATLVLGAVPSGGGVPALEAILAGHRVGFSTTTLAAPVVARMPAVYQLLPPKGVTALLDCRARPLDEDLHDVEVWDSHGWDPFAARAPIETADEDAEALRSFFIAALRRARSFHAALAQEPETPCPARVALLGGDCLPTLARAIVPERPGTPPRFEPWTRAEAEVMTEAGDGRVTRASALASHLPAANTSDDLCGIPEVSRVFVGAADHHGIYSEPSFQSVLLRLLLRPSRPISGGRG
jgi:pimeloyl-ACP methyl ester carboxylesterase